MKSLTKSFVLILFGALLATTITHAGVTIRIGKNSARFYYQSPARWHNNKVHLDCTYVRRLKNAPRVDGLVFFTAHTFDRKYRASGGRIVVAVPVRRADAFAQRYGTTLRYKNRRHGIVRHTSLRGVFRWVDGDVVYLDLSGQSPDLKIADRDYVRKAVIYGIPTRNRPLHKCYHRRR